MRHQAILGTMILLTVAGFRSEGLAQCPKLGSGVKRSLGVMRSEGFKPNPLGPSKQSYPLARVELTHAEKAGLHRAMGRAFPLSNMVVLKTPAHLPLAPLQDVVSLGGYWFVIDRDEDAVYRFAASGDFLGVVGSVGQGPGEYLSATHLAAVFDGHLGVTDSQKGVIHVFDVHGNHVLSTPRQGAQTGWLYASGRGYVWDHYERLIMAGAGPGHPAELWHVIYQVPEERPAPKGTIPNLSIHFGFGDRFHHYREQTGADFVFNAFAAVGETIWTGSPYDSRIQVYDRDGRFMAVLEHPCTKGMTHEQLRTMDADALNNSYWDTTHGKNFGIYPMDKLVLVNHGNPGVVIYDVHGNLVHDKHLYHDISQPLSTVSNLLITEFKPEHDPAHRRFPAEFAMLEAQGFTGEALEDYSFLRIGAFGGSQ